MADRAQMEERLASAEGQLRRKEAQLRQAEVTDRGHDDDLHFAQRELRAAREAQVRPPVLGACRMRACRIVCERPTRSPSPAPPTAIGTSSSAASP